MKLADLIPGGLADDKPDWLYTKDQVRKGTKVELEHVDSKAKAKEIAKDHLEEQREAGETQDYYDKLLKMEGKKHASFDVLEAAPAAAGLSALGAVGIAKLIKHLRGKAQENQLEDLEKSWDKADPQRLAQMLSLFLAEQYEDSGGTDLMQRTYAGHGDAMIGMHPENIAMLQKNPDLFHDFLQAKWRGERKDLLADDHPYVHTHSSFGVVDPKKKLLGLRTEKPDYGIVGAWGPDKDLVSRWTAELQSGKVQPFGPKVPGWVKKQGQDEGSEPDFDALEANSTAARPISLHADRLEKELDRAQDEEARLLQESTDPNTGEFSGTPDQAERLNGYDNEIGGLHKLIRQVRYNIKDTLTPGQVRTLANRTGPASPDALRPGGEAETPQKAAASRSVSPHGREVSFPETNKASADTGGNLMASLGLNIGGGTSGRKATKPVLSNPVYTGSGNIADNVTPGSVEKASSEKIMDVYEKRAAEVFDHRPSIVDLREIKVAFFFEGFADALEKRGYYVAHPTEFFVGLYESLREHFEGPAKLASGVYQPHVVNACELFTRRMTKAAGFEQLKPVNPLEAADQAQANALGVSPARQEKRQDIIDAMLPHAETISLDPDGKIKLKMPSPEATGVMDPQMLQQQQMATMQGREQAQAANQQPVPTGEEAPAPMEQGQGGEQGEISPESLQASEQALAAAGGGQGQPEQGGMPPEMGGGSGGIEDENKLIQALMAQMQGAAG